MADIIARKGELFTKVIVRSGDIVDGLGFEITGTTEDGNTYTSQQFVNGPGGTPTEIALQPDERITQISGSYGRYNNGNYITTIKIHTNLKPDGYGPYGEAKNAIDVVNFASPNVFGNQKGDIVGFSLIAGAYLESVGIYAKYGPYVSLA